MSNSKTPLHRGHSFLGEKITDVETDFSHVGHFFAWRERAEQALKETAEPPNAGMTWGQQPRKSDLWNLAELPRHGRSRSRVINNSAVAVPNLKSAFSAVRLRLLITGPN